MRCCPKKLLVRVGQEEGLGKHFQDSNYFKPEQKCLIMRRLETRIGKDGVLRVISQQTRSQLENSVLHVPASVQGQPQRSSA